MLLLRTLAARNLPLARLVPKTVVRGMAAKTPFSVLGVLRAPQTMNTNIRMTWQTAQTLKKAVFPAVRHLSTTRTNQQVKMDGNEHPNLRQKYAQHGPFRMIWNIIPAPIKFLGFAFFLLNVLLFITMPWLFVILPPVVIGMLWFGARVTRSQFGAMNQRWVGMAQQSLVYKCKGPLKLEKLNARCVRRIHAAINDDEKDINSVLKVNPFAMTRNGQSLTLDPTGRISQSHMLFPREAKADSQNPFDDLPGRKEMIVFEELLLDKSIESAKPSGQVIGIVEVVLTHDASFDPFATHYKAAENVFNYRLEVRPTKTLWPETSDFIILNDVSATEGDFDDASNRIIDVDPVSKEHFGNDDKSTKK